MGKTFNYLHGKIEELGNDKRTDKKGRFKKIQNAKDKLLEKFSEIKKFRLPLLRNLVETCIHYFKPRHRINFNESINIKNIINSVSRDITKALKTKIENCKNNKKKSGPLEFKLQKYEIAITAVEYANNAIF
ncbi:MAG: hypothetical protein RsTaC01_0747 [Candidatus Paraimprobicoccus trichonymphae]|uniref:Uncharacterized protein n=1 Tax=Candidatus Paraimprobicoccus trichonymphae TaxID=3033793 RepID=A0AA48I331_9FIRM|nr:MAG: hypothetical protein RsTaC01_0747 [Candidatus Paraimprobicoccus trichonymphae]